MWKKIMVLVLIFCLVFVVTACTDSINDEEEAAETSGEVTEGLTEITEDLEGVSEDLGG